MTEIEISLLAKKVAADTQFWIALTGVFGAVVGVIVSILGNLLQDCLRGKTQRRIDRCRQKLLRNLLEDETFQWRKLSTLSSVIGCNEEQTKAHLIAIGARGSEKSDDMWGLISRNPLPKFQQ